MRLATCVLSEEDLTLPSIARCFSLLTGDVLRNGEEVDRTINLATPFTEGDLKDWSPFYFFHNPAQVQKMVAGQHCWEWGDAPPADQELYLAAIHSIQAHTRANWEAIAEAVPGAFLLDADLLEAYEDQPPRADKKVAGAGAGGAGAAVAAPETGARKKGAFSCDVDCLSR